jgi:hypothetical protein
MQGSAVSRTLIAEQINFPSPAGPQGGHEGTGGGSGGVGHCEGWGLMGGGGGAGDLKRNTNVKQILK